ncbi:bifunctional metallophosphatase/5'-nucleotidase [Rummeliibacillus pycnus]|uniref:bifunctional metallophosphatase/5'-nucleotidase n=1 Tax=Rummeliibacillus pycnus TaxID=101070 RepID=UPI001FE31A48|nr:bifunctional UDP-sugar hydrolase/5'-nucleotidase [Rummeliibacillus pycnus]
MFKKKIVASLGAAALLMAPLSGYAKTTKVDSNVPVQFLAINDLHGNIGESYKATDGTPIGGAASLAYNFEQEKSAFAKKYKLKSTTTNSLTVQAGDLVGGSPSYSSLLQDEPTMNVANAMKFQVGALGNHEFDEGIEEFQRILKGQAPTTETQNYDLVKDYKQTKSNMEVLSANIVDKKTKKLLTGFKPYTVKKVNGVKVGFIGIVTPDIKTVVLSKFVQNIEVTDPAKAIAKYDKILRKEGIKAIVVIAHSGAYNTDADTSIETQGQDKIAGPSIDMLKELEKIDPNHSVDVVFGGHDHNFANGVYKKTRIIEAKSFGKAYSVVEGTLSKKTKDFIKTPAAVVKYNYAKTEDEINSNKVSKSVNSIVNNAKELVKATTDRPIATASFESISKDRKAFPLGGSPVGNLVTDAQLNRANTLGYKADFAMTNSGGIRADLTTVKDGDKNVITWGKAQAVQPFGNYLKVVKMTGANIKEAINQQFTGGYGLEVSGLHYTYNAKGVVDVFVGNTDEKIDPAKSYNVVINDFIATGGDKFTAFTTGTNEQIIEIDTDAFINYLSDLKHIEASTDIRNLKVD